MLENDWDGRGRLLGGEGKGRGRGHDDIDLERNQFGRQGGKPVELSLGIAVLNDDVATLDVT
jgi:hypothetical protein